MGLWMCRVCDWSPWISGLGLMLTVLQKKKPGVGIGKTCTLTGMENCYNW